MRPSGFDSRPFARVIPFTFEFEPMGTGKQVAAGTLSLRLVDQTGISQQDSLYLDVMKDGKLHNTPSSLCQLELVPGLVSRQRRVLRARPREHIPTDEGVTSVLDQLSSGFLNVAVGSMTDVDWTCPQSCRSRQSTDFTET